MVDEEKRTNEALDASKKYNTVVEEANDYIEHFDILETITNVGNDEVFTPRKTCDMMLDSLPEEVWHNPLYKWLNPATKNGIFEREIALRLDKGLENVITDKEERRKHILQNMIFSIGQTKFTSNVARRTLYYCSQANRKCDGLKASDGHYVNGYAIGNGSWFDDEEGNILTPCTNHDIDPKTKKCKYCGISNTSKYLDANQREQYAYEFIHVNHLVLEKHLQKRFFGGNKTMKFDIIIGNPPYQLNVGAEKEDYAIPIYQLFIQQAISLNPKYLCMIVPARWYTGGRGLDEFRAKMLNDRHIQAIHDFPDSSNCFPTVNIRGGVCYFVWNREYNGDCEISTHMNGKINGPVLRPLLEKGADTFIRYNQAISIVNKVKSHNERTFNEIVGPQTPFGIVSSYKGESQKKHDDDVRIYVSGHESEHRGQIRYVPKKMITAGFNYIPKHKVYLGEASSSVGSFPHSIITVPFYGEPDTCCTQSYLVIGPFNSKLEADNCISYMKTKFFRFMVLQRKNTQHNMSHVFKYVPLLSFDKSYSDDELFKKYKLSKQEIDFINSMVKEMD